MTNKEAYQFINVLLELKPASNTKLEHAKDQTLKNSEAFIEKYNDKIEDLSIDYCSTDEKGNIVRDSQRQYIFTKENQRLLTKELKKFLNEATAIPIEIVTTSDTKGLSDQQIEYFKDVGFIR